MANKQVGIEISTKDNASHKIDEINKKLNNLNIIMAKVNANRIDIMGNNNSVVVNQVIDGMNKVGDSAKKTNTTFKDMFSVAKLSAFAYSLKRIFSTMTNLTKESANFVENLNLTEVAFNGNTSAVKNLYTTMSDLYNLDESQIVRRIGVFKQMANAMGLSEEAGQNLSELLNKMTLDVSSLYNISIGRASNALQNALVGQTRPIRGATGADITEKTLERTVVQITPDRYIRDLSFLEKRLVMIISLTSQLSNSQGDWARTIESTDNQLRILNEQTTRFSRALGNVLMPIIGKLLPYLNAFMMVLTEITNAFARLVGFKLPKFDYSGLKGVSDGALDIEEQLNGASESANKLKSGLRSFDKLNVTTTPSTGVGAGVGSGIDPRIMEAFNKAAQEYDDMMDKVQTKASKIADNILKGLGFLKLSNGQWKFTGNFIQKATLLAIGLLGTVKLIGIAIKLFGLKNTIKNFVELKTNASKTLGVIDKIKIGLLGIIAIGSGISIVSKAFADMEEQGLNWSNVLQTAFGVILTSIGAMTIAVGVFGATFSIATAGISLLIGALVAFGGGLLLSSQELSLAEQQVKSYDESLKQLITTANETYSTTEANTIIAEKNLESLLNLYDANGKLSGSYEDAETKLKLINDALGTEYKLNKDGTVTIDGKRITLKNLEEQINSNIETMKKEAIIEAYRPVYVENVKKQIDMQDKYKKKQDEVTQALEGFDTLDEKSKTKWFKNNEKLLTDLNTYQNAYETSSNAIREYENLITNAQKGNMEEATKNASNMSKVTKKEVETTFAETATNAGLSIGEIEKTLNSKLTGTKTLNFDLRMKKSQFDKLQSELNKLDIKLSPKLVTGFYASGGLPPTGQLFVANEAGPEVVTTLGGKSVVANMEQMMTYLDRRMDTKLGGSSNTKQSAIINIQVGSKEIAKVVLEDLNDIAKNNGQALRIGV